MNKFYLKSFLVLCFTVLVLSPEETTAEAETPRPSKQDQDLLETIVTSVQAGIKMIMDRVMPSIEIRDNTGTRIQDITLPPILGGAQLLPLGCPKCKSIDTTKLEGTWRLIYANDNFIKVNMMTLSKLTADSDQSVDGSISPGKLKASTIVSMFTSVRFPVCVKLQIGRPISYGFLMDYPLQFAYKSGTASGPLHVGYGNFRLFQDGKIMLIAGNGAYNVKLCIVESNIQGVFPNEPVPVPPVFINQSDTPDSNLTFSNNYTEIIKRLNSSSDVINSIAQDPYFIVLSDTSGFPGCQNYLVLVNDELTFIKKYDRYVVEWLKRISADNDINPLQYLGCPCGFTIS